MSETRMIDRNGMRGGAAISAIALVVGWIAFYGSDTGTFIVAAVSVALGAGSVFGPRRAPLGALYRFIKRTLKLRIPVEPEPEAPPRFAQTIGFVFTAAAAIFLFRDSDAAGWALALIVAALQALLAVTGICVGCEMYLFGKRLTARSI